MWWALAYVVSSISGCASPAGPLFVATHPPRVWPPPPEIPRIQLLGVISGSSDLRAGRSSSEAFQDALRGRRPPIRFSSPQAIAVRGSDEVAVTDGNGGAIHLLDLHSREHRVVYGSETEAFGVPMGVAWAGARLFVADAQRHDLVELDREGRWVRSFGADSLVRPVGITFVPSRGLLYVVDGGAHNLAVFDLDGRRLRTVGTRGSATGEFNYPTHIGSTLDRLLVADSGNFRVQILDLDGNVMTMIGKKGDGAGDFSLPKGVAGDGEGHVYVVDAHFEAVQVFDETGQLLMAFGEEGGGPGTFSLPTGITLDDQGRIWVADSENRRVQVFTRIRTPS